MKSFVSASLLVASAALASAQSSAVYNSSTGSYSCPIANGTYCVGSTNIIIRCIDGVGYPGNCNDNLSGEPPINELVAECYTSPTVPGQAACSKNCIVYGGSGNINGTFTIPGCSPISTSSASVVTTITATNTTATATTTTASVSTVVPPPISITTVSPTIVIPLLSFTTVTPLGTAFSVVPTGAVGTGAAGTGGVGPSSNGTAPGNGGSGSSGSGSGGSSAVGGGTATAIPVGPTKTTAGTGAATFTGAAPTNVAAAGIAAAGLLIAALL